jgi:glycerol-3-phosphate acyltransferase PlsY
MLGFGAVSPFAGVLAAIIGYLAGSIPFGLLLTKAAGLGDLRKIGSGNIGATNVLRTGNKKVAALTLACDLLKATVPVIFLQWQWGQTAALIAGIAAFIGHLFPIWLKFKGGKGVATYLGILLGLAWPLAILFVVIWLGVALMFRRSSVAALAATAMTPLSAWLTGNANLIGPLAVLAAAIWFMHRANIARLLRGEEPPIAFGKRAGDAHT